MSQRTNLSGIQEAFVSINSKGDGGGDPMAVMGMGMVMVMV